MIKDKSNEEKDIFLLGVLSDPILLGEFLRNTADGETNRALWPKMKFEYRPYQKMIISDKNPFIVLTGGRAIGKCQPRGSRVLTDTGYKPITELITKRMFTTYSLNEKGEYVLNRAVAFRDKKVAVYEVTTESGFTLHCTANHPLLSKSGYKILELLSVGDEVGVTKGRIPFNSNKSAFSPYELRYLGYTIFSDIFRPTTRIKPRYAKQYRELEIIAENMMCVYKMSHDGHVWFDRQKGPYKHPVESLHQQLGLQSAANLGLKSIPVELMEECLDNCKIFLEAAFTQYANLSKDLIVFTNITRKVARDLQEMLQRFSVYAQIAKDDNKYKLIISGGDASNFWLNFNLVGVTVDRSNLAPYVRPYVTFEKITSIIPKGDQQTYGITVYNHENYISDSFFVHNSIIEEDKIIYGIINNDTTTPITPEALLVTSNTAQMTPILDRVTNRFSRSPFMRHFIGNFNKSKGTLDFNIDGRPYRLNARIAGLKGENNMVGQHVPVIYGDEMQLFPVSSFTQLEPAFNGWEPGAQQFYCGVPNGLRNSVLYTLSQNPNFKHYRVPSHQNPYYTLANDLNNLRKYGGVDDNLYQQLVLGNHGEAALQLISRDNIRVKPFDFTYVRYTATEKNRGLSFRDVFDLNTKFEDKCVFSIDTGFVDPTIIHVYRVKQDTWELCYRFKLQRIDFSEQELIINALDNIFTPSQISIDIGAGGGGASLVHNLINRPEYAGKQYEQRLVPVTFNENIEYEGVTQDTKSFAGRNLARIITSSQLVFSEFDHEGISQVERAAVTKQINGKEQFYILNDKGGASKDDHIFASLLCFVVGVLTGKGKEIQKRVLPKGIYT